MSHGQTINADQILLPEGDVETTKEAGPLSPGMTVSEAERLLIMKTLEFTGQNRTRAAEMLGIIIRTLRNKLNEYKGSSYDQDLR